jgi:hypothetical protein
MAKIIMQPIPGVKTPEDVRKEIHFNRVLGLHPYRDLCGYAQGQVIQYQIMWYAGTPCRVPDEIPTPRGWIEIRGT